MHRREFLRSLVGIAGLFVGGCHRQQKRFPPVEGSSSAQRAVEGARRFAGTSLNVAWESGPQAHGIMTFAAPLWEELTGIRINIVEIGQPLEQFHRILAEHRAGTAALDCAAIVPSFMEDLLAEKALEPLDDYVAHYHVPKDLRDYLPLYRNLGLWEGRRYGFFDDGDTLLLYYRKDLFEDASIQRDFATRYGYPLKDPRGFDWKQFIDAARFFTEGHAPDLYGLAPLTRELCWACFEYRLRLEGGQFFALDSMKPGVDSLSGRRALTQVNEMLQVMVPVGAMETSLSTSISSYLSGKTAMAIFWPPLALWAELRTRRTQTLDFSPRSQVVGRTGYALLPGQLTQMAVGFVLSVLAHSRHKEAAYLFIQWLSSPEISLRRVMNPDTLRDPYRYSHIHSPEFRELWPTAGEYLDLLEKAATDSAFLDLMIPGTYEYEAAFFETLTNLRLGTAVEPALDQMAQSWESITDRRGRTSQQRAYADFLRMPGATIPSRK